MAWFSFGGEDLGRTLRSIDTRLSNMEKNQMATNDELQVIAANLAEAQDELSVLPARIEELLAQVGDQADPALVADIRARSEALKNIVPNVEVPPVTE